MSNPGWTIEKQYAYDKVSEYVQSIYHLPMPVARALAESDATQAQVERIATHIALTMSPRLMIPTCDDQEHDQP